MGHDAAAPAAAPWKSTYKLELIRRMLDLYHDLPFVLIGDSGQRDPERIYAQVPGGGGEVLAICVRNVTSATERHHAITGGGGNKAGSSLILAHDSSAMGKRRTVD